MEPGFKPVRQRCGRCGGESGPELPLGERQMCVEQAHLAELEGPCL